MKVKKSLDITLLVIVLLVGAWNHEAIFNNLQNLNDIPVVGQITQRLPHTVEEETKIVCASVEPETKPVNQAPVKTEVETCEEGYTVEEMSAVMYAVTNSNIRKGPSTDYEIIGGAKTGKALTITGRADTGWYRVDLGGKEGFISGKLVSYEAPVNEEPVSGTTNTGNEPEVIENNSEAQAQETPADPTPEPVVEPEPVAEVTVASSRTPVAVSPAASESEQAMINSIVAQVVTPNMSDREIAVAMNNYLCAILTYDNSYSSYTTVSALTSGRAICQGYANAYWRLMNAAGIPTDYVRGYANGGRHGWNRCLIDGVYYYVDVTWNDSLGNNNYLLISYDQISRDHTETELNPYRNY